MGIYGSIIQLLRFTVCVETIDKKPLRLTQTYPTRIKTEILWNANTTPVLNESDANVCQFIWLICISFNFINQTLLSGKQNGVIFFYIPITYFKRTKTFYLPLYTSPSPLTGRLSPTSSKLYTLLIVIGSMGYTVLNTKTHVLKMRKMTFAFVVI